MPDSSVTAPVADPAPVPQPTHLVLDDGRPVSGSLLVDLQPSFMGEAQAGRANDALDPETGNAQPMGSSDSEVLQRSAASTEAGLNLRVVDGGIRMPASLVAGRPSDDSMRSP